MTKFWIDVECWFWTDLEFIRRYDRRYVGCKQTKRPEVYNSVEPILAKCGSKRWYKHVYRVKQVWRVCDQSWSKSLKNNVDVLKISTKVWVKMVESRQKWPFLFLDQILQIWYYNRIYGSPVFVYSLLTAQYSSVLCRLLLSFTSWDSPGLRPFCNSHFLGKTSRNLGKVQKRFWPSVTPFPPYNLNCFLGGFQ